MSADYAATQAVIFEGRVTCPNCGGKGIGRVPGWREPLVTCPLCQAEMRSPFTGLTTVTAAEADVWVADTPDVDETPKPRLPDPFEAPRHVVNPLDALRAVVTARHGGQDDPR